MAYWIGEACALALSCANSDPLDGPDRGIGQQALKAVLDSQRHEDSNERVQRDPLSFLESSYRSRRHPGFLGELALGHIAGKPYAL